MTEQGIGSPAVDAAPPEVVGAPTGDRAARAAANRISSIVLVSGGILLVVGSFLPWAELTATGEGLGTFRSAANGWSTLDGEVDDGPVFVVLGLVLVALGVLAVRGITSLGTKLVAFFVSTLALLFALAEIGSVQSDNDDLAIVLGGDVFTLGPGLFMLLGGAVLALVGSILLRRRVRPR